MEERERETLKRLWFLSMHSRCPIWLARQMQKIVTDALGGEDVDVNEALRIKVVALTAGEVEEIRERERAMMG